MASFGPRHRVVPNQNRGQGVIAQRRLDEAAGRAAEKTRVSVSVDAHPSIVHLHNPRGTIACPCSMRGGYGTDASRGSNVVLDVGEGDAYDGIDSGYPLENARDAHYGELPADGTARDVGLAVQRLLMGNGKRCGICWGTGWIDAYQMWGGNRRIMCIADALGVELLSESGIDVDADASTPTMIGPGTVTWSVRVNLHDVILDALRVRDGLVASQGGYELTVSADGGRTFESPSLAMSMMGRASNAVHRIAPGTYVFRLHLRDGARVSHVELFSRSEPLVNLQLPQLVQSASAELVAPFLNEDFELDPIVGNVERGTIIDVRPHDGIGELWMVTDVTVKKTASGQIFGIVGTAKNAQPTDAFACASIGDDLASGILDRGHATRGLEGNGMGVPMGPDETSDDSVAAARRGSSQVLGGGHVRGSNTIVLSTGDVD